MGSRGFTLLELLVVLLILALLVSIVAPRLIDKPDQARVQAARADMQTIVQALRLYKLDNGAYPSAAQGLEALVKKPEAAPQPPNWKPGGYLERMPRDPWGQPYVYLNPGLMGEIDIMTLGSDGRRGGEGHAADLGSWEE